MIEHTWMAKVDNRARWFEEGARALRLVLEKQGRADLLPPVGEYYACPCCLIAHPRQAVDAKFLTFEDVPPKALGGRRMLLTCRNCNNSSGGQFDSDAVRKAIANDFVRGAATGEIRATFYIDGIPLRGTAQSTATGVTLANISRQNDPKVETAFLSALDSVAEDKGNYGRLSFTVHTRYKESRARISWIRTAYLAAFASLGWSYILRPVLRPIRDQLLNPDARLLETYLMHNPESPKETRRLLIVQEPYELPCVAVVMGEYTVFLPALFDPLTWDETATALCGHRDAEERLNVAFNGKEVPWPKYPTYLLDMP